jgi:hypothetical protein
MKNLDAYADSCVKFKDKIRAILADIGLVRSDDYDIIVNSRNAWLEDALSPGQLRS